MATKHNFPIGCVKNIEMEERNTIYFAQVPQSQPGSDIYMVVDGSLMQCYPRQLDAEANQCLFMKTMRGIVTRSP